MKRIVWVILLFFVIEVPSDAHYTPYGESLIAQGLIVDPTVFDFIAVPSQGEKHEIA